MGFLKTNTCFVCTIKIIINQTKKGCLSYNFSEFCIYGNDDFGNNHDKGTLFLIWDRFWITISTKRWRFVTPWSFSSLSEGKLVKQLSIWAFWCLFQLFFFFLLFATAHQNMTKQSCWSMTSSWTSLSN